MCTTVLAYRYIPGVSLLLLSNRDEFYDRPAAPAHVWSSEPALFGGRDLQAGGSWLGCSVHGCCANVTNVREPKRSLQNARSRGNLVTEFLLARESATAFADRIEGHRYNGFNLLLWDGDDLTFASNRGPVRILKPGIYGMSNGRFESDWPKVARARTKLAGRIHRGVPDPEDLLEILLDSTPADDDLLPDTGVPRDWERTLSSVFIRTPKYGTRCSTIVEISSGGKIDLREFTHTPERACASRVHLRKGSGRDRGSDSPAEPSSR